MFTAAIIDINILFFVFARFCARIKGYDNGEVTLPCFFISVLEGHLLLASWSVRLVKNCDRGLEYVAPRRRARRQHFQFFTIRTNPEPFLPAETGLQLGFFTQRCHLIGLRAVYRVELFRTALC